MASKLNADWIRYIFTNMEEAVCVIRMNGELVYANASAEKLFGFRAGCPVKIWEAIPHTEENDDLYQMFIDGVTEKQRSFHSIVNYVNQQGKVYHLHVSLTCDPREEGMLLIVISDLTHLTRIRSALVRYTSPGIAEYVLSDPEGERPGGQARDVSILMSDLRGFTAMSGRMASGELVRMLNHYFEWMATVIERHSGTVIEFLGDGIFAVFGAPGDLPDHAGEAVACAVEMQQAMAAVNQWNREQGYPELEMGIGISSGPAVVGNIGSEKKMKYGCMGETVNLASRIESLSIGGQVLISGETGSRIASALTIASEKSVMLKGMTHEVRVSEVTGIGSLRLREGALHPQHWIRLKVERDILLFHLNGKTVDPVPREGRLVMLSRDERYGVLETGAELKPLQNLMLRIGEQDIYAKVLDRMKEGYRLYLYRSEQPLEPPYGAL